MGITFSQVNMKKKLFSFMSSMLQKFENYIKSKFRIIENQTAEDYFIYCIDDETIVKHLELLTLNTNPLPFSMKQEVKKGGYIKNDQMMRFNTVR